MKTVLQILGVGSFVWIFVFLVMKGTEVPEITFTTLPNGEEIVWEAKYPDGTKMSIQEAQKIHDGKERYVRQTIAFPYPSRD